MTTPRYRRFRYKNTKAEMVYLGGQLAANCGHLFRKSLRPIKKWPVTDPTTWGFVLEPFAKNSVRKYGLLTAPRELPLYFMPVEEPRELPLYFMPVEEMIFYLKSMLAVSQMQTTEILRWYEVMDGKMGLNSPKFPLGESLV